VSASEDAMPSTLIPSNTLWNFMDRISKQFFFVLFKIISLFQYGFKSGSVILWTFPIVSYSEKKHDVSEIRPVSVIKRKDVETTMQFGLLERANRIQL
jgi:hypothetical protein